MWVFYDVMDDMNEKIVSSMGSRVSRQQRICIPERIGMRITKAPCHGNEGISLLMHLL